jgi:hypothetical protein
MYDLGQGQLKPFVIADKQERPGSLMSGSAAQSLTAKDGQTQLTLYERNANDQAFVHVLPIGEEVPYAFCVDLPAPSAGWVLTPSPDGQRFYAVNPLSMAVAAITARGSHPPDVRTAHIRGQAAAGFVRTAEAKEPVDHPTAAVSPDGSALYLAQRDSLTRIETRQLASAKAEALTASDRVGNVVFGPSGWLYAVSASTGEMLRVDPATLRVAWRSAPAFRGYDVVRVV